MLINILTCWVYQPVKCIHLQSINLLSVRLFIHTSELDLPWIRGLVLASSVTLRLQVQLGIK